MSNIYKKKKQKKNSDITAFIGFIFYVHDSLFTLIAYGLKDYLDNTQ